MVYNRIVKLGNIVNNIDMNRKNDIYKEKWD